MGGRGVVKSTWYSTLKQLFSNIMNNKKRRYLVLIALVGVFLMVFSNQLTTNEKEPSSFDQSLVEQNSIEVKQNNPLVTDVYEMEKSYESKLQQLLNQMSYISEVEVMVNIDSTNVNVYEKDLTLGKQLSNETDQNGGMRQVEDETNESRLVVVREGDKEKPLLIQTKKPEIRGVLIIAKGAESPNTKKLIIDAVAKVLGVPTYKISIMSK